MNEEQFFFFLLQQFLMNFCGFSCRGWWAQSRSFRLGFRKNRINGQHTQKHDSQGPERFYR